MALLLGITTNGKIGLGLVALIFIAFALISSFVLPRRNPDFPGERVGVYIAVATLLFVAMLAAVVVFAKEEGEAEGHGAEVTETASTTETNGETTATTETGTGTETGGAGGDGAAGEEVYASAGCGDCHTLEAAGSSGRVGPNLDESQPDAALVEERVREGSGAMPSFEGELDDKQIADVTAYVVQSTSG